MAPLTPLVRPQAYFRTKPVSVSVAIIVFAVYLFGSIATLYAVTHLLLEHTRGLPRSSESAVFDAIRLLNLLLIPLSILALLVIAALLHWLSGGTDGEGTYGDALAVAAWGHAPQILSFPVEYAHLWYHLRDRRIDISSAEAFTAEQEAFEASIEFTGLPITVIFSAWTVYILAYGTVATHDTELTDTIGPALLVGLGLLVLSIV